MLNTHTSSWTRAPSSNNNAVPSDNPENNSSVLITALSTRQAKPLAAVDKSIAESMLNLTRQDPDAFQIKNHKDEVRL